MTLSMYQASVPVFIHMLTNLSNILTIGAKNGIDPLEARLHETMFPLARQVQIATDVSKGCGARLAGIDAPPFEDTEKTFAELQARIQKTLAFLQTLTPAQIDGSEEKEIALKVGGRDMHFKGQDYLLTFALPNLYFHVTTTYAILRNNGVDLGKMDYLGGREKSHDRAA